MPDARMIRNGLIYKGAYKTRMPRDGESMENENGENSKNSSKSSKSVTAPIIIGLSVIISCIILMFGFISYKTGISHSITATGSAHVDFDSDLVVWRGSFAAHGDTSQAAYSQIKNDAATVKKYLLDNGLKEDETVFNSVDISRSYDNQYDDKGNVISSTPTGYDLTQKIVITSNNIDTVEKISRDISSLLDSGVEFTSESPEYYSTKLDDVKLDLIDKATQNAKSRIDIMAKDTGSKTGKLISSDLGVFQITAKNSGTSGYSYDGSFDTSSRQKTATITVSLKYAVK